MRRRLPAVLTMALLAAPAAAATDDPLITDRPDFTESTATVTRGRIQLEGGYTFTGSDAGDEHAFGELLARFGMTETLEFRLGVNSYVRQELPGGDVSGREDLTIGVKARLSDPLPAGSRQPQVAVILATSLESGTGGIGAPAEEPQLTLAFSWELTQNTALGSNLGFAWRRDDERYGEQSASLALGHGLSDRLGVYVELFGFARPGRRNDDQFLNAGLTWSLSADTQLDLRAGAGLNSTAPDYFVGAGAAWRW